MTGSSNLFCSSKNEEIFCMILSITKILNKVVNIIFIFRMRKARREPDIFSNPEKDRLMASQGYKPPITMDVFVP